MYYIFTWKKNKFWKFSKQLLLLFVKLFKNQILYPILKTQNLEYYNQFSKKLSMIKLR